MASREQSNQAFSVELEGIELSEERRAAIASGIRQTVLGELAGIDFEGDRHAALILGRPGGGTQGIKAIALSRDRLSEVDRLTGGD